MIHVSYGLYDKTGRYSKFTATSMVSMFENTKEKVTVHILHDNTLSQENQNKLSQIAERYGQIVKYYNVDILCPERIAEINRMFETAAYYEKFSIGATFRLIMENLIDAEKTIYLDSDTIINLDINELWQFELEDKPLASIAELDIGLDHSKFTDHTMLMNKTFDYKNYFCSGVLVVDLEYLRNNPNLMKSGMNFVFQKDDCNYFDQDVLNYCFIDNYVHLPEKFNVFTHHERPRRSTLRPAIYHYASHSLFLNPADNFNRLWIKYFAMTPFFNEEMFVNLYGGIQQLYIQQKKFAIKISEIMAGKKRVFFINSRDVNALKNIFQINSNEKIILADSPNSLKILVDTMKNSKGKQVAFLVINEFQKVSRFLTNAGFTFGKDFLNGIEFLSDAEGVPFDSRFMLRLL